jgi:RNA polymerase sigma-70 factor (ECF subfamily)
MNETSLSLLARVRESEDPHSWNRLFELYEPLLRRWLSAYDVQDADAADLIQDVFAVVARELPGFEHNQNPGAFRSWLRKVLANRLKNSWRSRNHRPQAAGGSSMLERLNQLEDDKSEASRVWDNSHDQDVITRLMELIRPMFLPKTWEAFRRQMFEGDKPHQIAEELDMSLGSVYMARTRVLNALRREAAGLVNSL